MILEAGRRVRAIVRARTRLRELRERRVRRRLAGPKLVAAFALRYPEAFFIEIGSNDGEQHDHLSRMIRTRPWRGIMVEPVPYVFERLRRNYGDLGRLAFENAAIADRDGQLPFYHLREARDEERDRLPGWYDAIGSFSREAVLKHRNHIPDLETRIVTAEVPAITFETLCERHAVEEIDLLVIDTEGYDHEIIKRIDWDTRAPRMLVYEHYHLAAAERAQCRSSLQAVGYETLAEGFDTWCLRTDQDDALSRTWQGLRPGIPELSADAERA